LSFTTHVNTIAAKAHARACLIHKCFISRDAVTLTRAFVAYVRPILEYASVVWSPYHVNQICKLESVQRRFTKRIAGLRDMPYVERLKRLQLDSLETRRLRSDLLFTYKVLFGLASVDWSSMFTFNSTAITRGHSYKLFGKTSRVNIRHHFFCNRVVNVWNNLPATNVNFSSFRAFKMFLSKIDLSAYLRK
jgi:hypothetical protein